MRTTFRMAELLETRWVRRSRCEEPEEHAEVALLEAADAGDPTAIAVYNDWLIDHGDPRGELAGLRAAPADEMIDARITELERECGIELFGLFAVLPAEFREQFSLVWRHGWIDEVIARHKWFPNGGGMYGEDAREAVHQVLHAPMARFVRWIDLDTAFAGACASLEACPHTQRIRRMRLHGVPQVLDAFPQLEELEVDAHAGRGHPAIRSLTLRTRGGGFDIAGDWPALHHLTIALDEPDLETFRALRTWLRTTKLHITELVIANDRRLPANVVEAMIEGPLLDHLEVLQLALPPQPRSLRKLEAALARRGARVVID